MTQTASGEAPSSYQAESAWVPVSLPETPYKGLSFYSEEDAPFFFGRRGPTQVVTANLMASRLTLLYGDSGVGKSSLLRAGVARELHDLARDNIQRRGRAGLVVVLFPIDDEGGTRASWSDEPIGSIAEAIVRAVESLGLDIEPPSRSLPFSALLAAWTELLGSDLLIILDQFEEYLLYHEGEDGDGTLATELPRALADANLRTSFLISIREDALARLDRFKGRIPTLFDNYLRINHLDQGGAREAIIKPIEKWNELSGGQTPITIEPKLVNTLLDELETGRVSLGLVGVGVSGAQAQARESQGERLVETPYLQLVMTRLWNEETRSGSTEIRLATLKRLGGCERIVKTHLDGTMKTLRRYPRYVAARVFHHLVTPSGTKIAHNARDLADYVGLAEADVEPVLEQLTAGDSRILRRVGAEGDDAPPRYEIFHDVLGAAILDWRARYLRAREVVQSIRRGATGFFQVLVGIGCAWALLWVLYESDYTGKERTFYLLWALTALAMWVIATVVLVRRWRRRAAWVVPPVGAIVAAIGPLTAAIAAGNGMLRLWSSGVRRLGGGRAREGSARAPTRSRGRARGVDARLRRFRGLTAISGAVVLVIACIVPSVEFEYWATSKRSSYSLLAGDARLWFALEPLVTAGVAGTIGVLLLMGRAHRRLASGVLAAVGVGGLAFFVAYLSWASALEPLFPPDRLGNFAFASLRGGVYLGAAGAALVLVAAAPTAVVEIFATMIGAGRMLQGASDHGPVLRTTPEERARRRRVAAGVLGFGGAILVGWGSFAPSGAWYREADRSLGEISNAAAFQALAPAALVALVALVLMRRPPEPRLAAGLLAGWGLVLLALFAGVVGSALGEHGNGAPSGGWVGLAGGIAIFLAGALAFREAGSRNRN